MSLQMPSDIQRSLVEKKFKINENAIILDGKTKLTVTYSHVDISPDITTATAVFKVVSKDKPASKPRKPKATPVSAKK